MSFEAKYFDERQLNFTILPSEIRVYFGKPCSVCLPKISMEINIDHIENIFAKINEFDREKRILTKKYAFHR